MYSTRKLSTDELIDEVEKNKAVRTVQLSQEQLDCDDIEMKIRNIFEDVLHITPIGRLENFFTLGGDSLSMLKAINRVLSVFSVEMQFADFFSDPTVEGLAKRLKSLLQ